MVCAVFTTWVTGVAEVDPSKLPSPEYTAWTSTPEEVAAQCRRARRGAGVARRVPDESPAVAHPVMVFQVSPPLVEYWKSTVPVGGVLSVPGGVTVTVAV